MVHIRDCILAYWMERNDIDDIGYRLNDLTRWEIPVFLQGNLVKVRREILVV